MRFSGGSLKKPKNNKPFWGHISLIDEKKKMWDHIAIMTQLWLILTRNESFNRDKDFGPQNQAYLKEYRRLTDKMHRRIFYDE